MSRPLKQTFRCKPLGDLATQLLVSPPAKRIDQVFRCERLHDEIDEETAYPFEYIAYRITGYRTETQADTVLFGAAVLPDLRLIIDSLSKTVSISAESHGPAETVDELAARLNISTRTVARWRRAGLRWRYMVRGDHDKPVLMFPRRGIEQFIGKHEERVTRASQFSPTNEFQRRAVIETARSLLEANPSMPLQRIAVRLGKSFERGVETVRQIILRHDAEVAEDHALFPQRTGPLNEHDIRFAFRAAAMGVSTAKIAERLRRSKSTVYRVIHQQRADAVNNMTISFIMSPLFDRDDADSLILTDETGEATAAASKRKVKANVDDLPPRLREYYAQAQPDAAMQRRAFLRFNYLKWKAATLRDRLNPYDPAVAELDEIEALLRDAMAAHGALISAHLPVVLSVCRRHLVGRQDASIMHLLELLAVGNELLNAGLTTFDIAKHDSFADTLTFNLLRLYARYSEQRPDAVKAKTAARVERMTDQVLAKAKPHAAMYLPGRGASRLNHEDAA